MVSHASPATVAGYWRDHFAAARPVLRERAWPNCSLLEISISSPGQLTLPPRAYHAVTTVAHGSCRVQQEGVRAQRSTGTTLVHSAGRSSDVAWSDAMRVRVACVDPAIVARIAEEAGVKGRVQIRSDFERSDAGTDAITLALAHEASLPAHPAQLLSVGSMAFALAWRLLGWVGALPLDARRRSALDARRVARVRELMMDTRQALSLTDVAGVAHVDASRIASDFARATGESPGRALMRARMEVTSRARSLSSLGCHRVATCARSSGSRTRCEPRISLGRTPRTILLFGFAATPCKSSAGRSGYITSRGGRPPGRRP